MTKGLLVARNVAGTGVLVLGAIGLLFASYVFVKEIPGLRRYLRMRSM